METRIWKESNSLNWLRSIPLQCVLAKEDPANKEQYNEVSLYYAYPLGSSGAYNRKILCLQSKYCAAFCKLVGRMLKGEGIRAHFAITGMMVWEMKLVLPASQAIIVIDHCCPLKRQLSPFSLHKARTSWRIWTYHFICVPPTWGQHFKL